MFQKSAFGSSTPGGSAFGASAFGATQPAFGQPAPAAGTSAFGTAAPAFGAPTAQTGGLFGSTATSTSGGGLFGSTAPASTGASGFAGFGGTGSAFGTNSAFRPPASNFGATNTGAFGANPGTSTGLFGATTQASSGGLFGATQPGTTSFTGGNTFGATNNAFTMGTNQQQVVGTTIKFNPPTGNDTMMKSGTQQSIQTRHLCITCMKEYENKSIEELRCEDYMANRKGGSAGGTTGSTGLFGAAPNQTAPGGTSLFGATPAASQANPFGAQANKPMFGAQTTTAGFGAASTPFGSQGTSAFGTNTSTSGGLFGAKPQTSFGQPASSSGFSFGQTTATSSAAGSLFGQTNQAKPFGVAAPQASGGLFGSTTPAFGTATSAAPAFGASNTSFGQPAAQNQSINLFGNQQKPASAFGTPFGQTATTSAPAFGGFGQSTATTAPFGQAKPAFGGFGTTATSSAPAFGSQPLGGFGTATPQQQPAGGLFGAQKPGAFNFSSTSQPSSGAFNMAGTTGGFGTSSGGLFGANTQKPGLFGATSASGGAFGTSTGFGTTPAGGFGSSLTGGFGASSTPFGGGFTTPATGLMQQPGPALGQASSATTGNSVHDYLSSLTANPYGDDPLFKNLVPGSQSEAHLEEILKPTNPAAQKALLLAGNQYKISPHRNVKVKPKPITNLSSGSGALKSNLSAISNSPLFDGLEDDDVMNSKNDLFVPRRSVKKLVIKPKSTGHQSNGIETRPLSRSGLQGINNITNDDSVAEGIINDDMTNKADDVSLNLPPIVGKDGLLANGMSPATRNVEGSFLDTRNKKNDQFNNSSSPASLSVSVPSTTSTPMIPSDRAKSANIGRSPASSDRESKNKKENPSRHICTSEESVLLNDSDNDSEDQRGLVEDAEEDDNDQSKHPAKIQLKRSQYYTMPPFSELASITDNNGDCVVENFVIGRAGYGNIFFPGMTNIAGMNFDELVIFRHKEVFVYPDDSAKPIVGEGLNKKAQVTLDKVWPIDKTVQNPIKSPEKLVEMNYEEKLRKACIRMGARFTEYRPETGSWVFNVEHFSKYGLQDSDDEDEPAVSAKSRLEGQKRFKTLQLRSDSSIVSKGTDQQQSIDANQQFMAVESYKAKHSTSLAQDNQRNTSATEASVNKSNLENNPLSVNVPYMNRSDLNKDIIGSKVKMMKAASLFDTQTDMDIDGGIPPPNVDISKMLVQPSIGKKIGEPRPIILESRSTGKNGKVNTSSSVLERRDIEDIAHSILTGSSIGNRGLGGNYSMEAAPPTLATSLLRTQYLTSTGLNLSTGISTGASNTSETPGRSLRFMDKSINAINATGRTPSKKLPRYSLQSGYDKYVALPTSEQVSNQQFNRPKVVAPQHVDTLLPLKECIMNPSSIKLLADCGLYMSRSFRVGWSNHWVLANPGNSIQTDGIEDKGPTEVLIEQHVTSSFGIVDEEQLTSLEEWLEVCLDNSSVTLIKNESDPDSVPFFEPNDGISMLTAFAEEAEHQSQLEGSNDFKASRKEVKQIWDLMVALWGKLPFLPNENISEMDDSLNENLAEADSHEMTMRRKEALSNWLESVVQSEQNADVHEAKLLKDKEKSGIMEELAYLSGNNIKEACDRAQVAGDHYSAILTSQAAGGATSFSSQMLFKYMELLQEANADSKVAEDRLHLYALVSGTPVWWKSEDSKINTLNDLDWKRAFAVSLWFLSTPSSSIADALAEYETAFLGHPQYGKYAVAPRPTYEVDNQVPTSISENHDIKFHLLKLYSDRSHGLENIITPATYTNDQLDHRLGWFVGQVLSTLGYRHLPSSRKVQLHSEFASQLEAFGLWHWSVFVLLHLNFDEDNSNKVAATRKTSVCEVLGRNVGRDEDSVEREQFLQEKLHVPRPWIAEAKAVYASTVGNYGDQAWYLIQARLWNAAHDVTVKKIAPDAIINDNYSYLYDLLQELSKATSLEGVDNDSVSKSKGVIHSNKIIDWDTKGRVFFDFINIDMEVKDLLKKRDEMSVGYHIEKLRPKVTSLCSRINSLPISTTKDRLCQSEIAKKVAHLIRAVLSLEASTTENSSISQSKVLAGYLAQLPLPDDYELQELRALSRMYMLELMDAS